MNGKEFISEWSKAIGEGVSYVEGEIGLPIWLCAVIVIVTVLAIALLFDSTQGRGRRYRRGYRVGYSETLGKERAKMRIEQEKEGKKRRGWRER